ncbi:MAG TPA: alpha-1,4-glucan--maltose-1-phosphate maltosyltransferase [Vicinamibacterales bacterium]|nr:alpha-1,4-glucan--maltose-1-phosphate maltosyltransferase [Vicinamibacterales bacterium]
MAPGAAALRAVITAVQPEIDAGRFPAKRTAGETVRVEADVFADGHDQVAADLVYRYAGLAADAVDGAQAPGAWLRVPMAAIGNDRWAAEFPVDEIGFYEFTIEAWVDRFATWRDALAKKFGAEQDVETELIEIGQLLRRKTKDGRLKKFADRIAPSATVTAGPSTALTAGGAGGQAERVAAALDAGLADAARREPALRDAVVRYGRTLRVMVERERARFGAWYEMFPRSAGPDPARSATFDEAAGRLPAIAAMGFDVVYLPPIHPIGTTARKGRNNTLTPEPDDPGSPWAIGSPDGGHTAVEPGLGTLDDFVRFVTRARDLGMEVALDIAFQTSPDHPWVTEHPEWFRHRPDGSIKYAENPPKRYQDIYPLDFESSEWPALWSALRDVFLFWIDQGVTIFRVDNPHTKPFHFWEWAIADIKARHPETVFLSEAFTRPTVMHHLARLGFSQSYTYFTWRNTKAELVDYFTELTAGPGREYMRPNLFANTPDILHEYLQQGGRPAFTIRLILAATLGASYGIYSGFELSENRPVKPGSEEYLDSEKYQYRQWNWDDPDSLAPLVTLLNDARHTYRALQSDWSLRFHDTDNDQIIAYSKQDSRVAVLVIVNVDHAHMQHGWVRVPVAHWTTPGGAIKAADLLTGETYTWTSEWNYVRLEPGTRPAHVLIIELPAPIAANGPRPPKPSSKAEAGP